LKGALLYAAFSLKRENGSFSDNNAEYSCRSLKRLQRTQHGHITQAPLISSAGKVWSTAGQTTSTSLMHYLLRDLISGQRALPERLHNIRCIECNSSSILAVLV
jgi:hypothetical protein